MKRQKLIIFPFNGNGIEALDCINGDQYDFIGFVDDDTAKQSSRYEIFDRLVISRYKEAHVLAVPGSPTTFKNRETAINSLSLGAHRFASVIHPSATIGSNVQLGYNCLIMAGVVITSNAELGNHICVLPNTVIHHDVSIHDYTLVGSNVVIAGGTKLGRNCYIGSGSNIINGITIGNSSLIGLGSNVLRDVESHTTIAGNPAVPLKTTIKQPLF